MKGLSVAGPHLGALLVAAGALFIGGCASNPPDSNQLLGHFTAASSFDVRGLDYDKLAANRSLVTGKACYEVDPKTLAYLRGPKENVMQRAMDNAIRNGQKQGIDGDLLVNVRVEQRTEHRTVGGFFKSEKRRECVFVSGELVELKEPSTPAQTKKATKAPVNQEVAVKPAPAIKPEVVPAKPAPAPVKPAPAPADQATAPSAQGAAKPAEKPVDAPIVNNPSYL
ncbi:hypothetical protein [Dongshaea marina]|uniref:hypothetical protein n=1 Tax=Dongshaea marina TaxID=2047966 RepID=UPI000D3E3D6E|nr:hypothetical protein [Dongshaea marina]